jgi:DNA-binding beta-propeller fold protein YncE
LAGAAVACLLSACFSKNTSQSVPQPPSCVGSGVLPPGFTAVLGGSVIEIALVPNALVYDSCRNVYYASVPGSQPSGNSIATIDPATGRVSYSAPVGAEPHALAIAADASVLYVGLDGTGDVAKLALPSMAELARTRLPSDGPPTSFGQTSAETIAVSPADPRLVAVALAYSSVSPGHAGDALLRDMVLQPRITQPTLGGNLIAFDSNGTPLYGLSTLDQSLRSMQVLPDGLAVQSVLAQATSGGSGQPPISFAGGRIHAGGSVFDPTALAPAGTVSGAKQCLRSEAEMLCVYVDFLASESRVLVVDPNTFVIQASLLFRANEPLCVNCVLVKGPPGQVAIAFTSMPGFDSRVLLFSDDQLLFPPVPPAVVWPVIPSSTDDGDALEIQIAHNALVYDPAHNRYYASVPGSVIGAGNSIATIDPATGQATQSAPVGSEPNALALAADGSALYVGLDGSGEVVRLSLPGMSELSRMRLSVDHDFGQARAESIAVSPADPAVVAVAMVVPTGTPLHLGAALLRDMVMQPKRTASASDNNLLAFDPSGSILYGLTTESTSFGLHANLVLPDGLLEQTALQHATPAVARTFSFSGNRLVAGASVYDAPGLTAAGRVSVPSLSGTDCVAQRSVAQLACFFTASSSGPVTNDQQFRILLADPATFVPRGSLLVAQGAPLGARAFLEGPDGQIAGSYPQLAGIPGSNHVLLFSSAKLVTPPTPPTVTWPVTTSTTADGQTLDIGIVHNDLVYDSGRNVYYASVPGLVIGAGNTIATIDPSTGSVVHSVPVGSDPNPLALAADGSALYVGLDGAGEVLKLAPPSMTVTGRMRLPASPQLGQFHAQALAVSPADPDAVAVTSSEFSFGYALLRGLVLQPQSVAIPGIGNLSAFDSAGTTLYGAATGVLLISTQVLADGLSPNFSAVSPAGLRSVGFANNLVVSGAFVWNTGPLTARLIVGNASDCWFDRTGNRLLCLGDSFNPGRVLVADPVGLAFGASLLYTPSEADPPRRLMQGPSGQVGLSYVPPFNPPFVRFFTSAQLP